MPTAGAVRHRWLVLVTAWIALAMPVWALDIQVVGLFAGKAVVEVDGARHVLGEGETSPEGVTLVSASSERAVLEVDGERRAYALGGRASTSFDQPEQAEVRIWRDGDGMFTKPGSINGQPVDFLVDTGASVVAMNAGQARRLGIAYRLDGRPQRVGTASGTARGYALTLSSVKVGDVRLRDVQAVVIDGPQPRHVLLGMSFLDRLEIENRGRVMVLRKKY